MYMYICMRKSHRYTYICSPASLRPTPTAAAVASAASAVAAAATGAGFIHTIVILSQTHGQQAVDARSTTSKPS